MTRAHILLYHTPYLYHQHGICNTPTWIYDMEYDTVAIEAWSRDFLTHFEFIRFLENFFSSDF
jgi:hypothetical protein